MGLVLLLSLFAGISFGGEVALFGANPYLRTKGKPNVYAGTFLGNTGTGKILVNNGNPDGTNRVDVAVILINGQQVIRPTDFDLPVHTIEAPVDLARNNSISIELRGGPGHYLTVTVLEEIVCTALDQCHVAGTWDRTLGQCSNPTAANGTACNDGNVCTQTDTCQTGVCVGSNPVVCAATDQCHTAGVCDALTGCSNPTVANGTACNDGNVCTQTDICQTGVCVGSNPVVCAAIDQCHTAGVCDAVTGCSDPAKPDGTACNDGNACTGTDTCQTGVCGGIAVACDDNNDCTSDSCDPAAGCVHTDQRTAVDVSPTQQRFTWACPYDEWVSLYLGAACEPWYGSFFQADEPHENYCGPTAGRNLLDWYGVPSTYAQLGSEMRTNTWMSGWDALGDCLCFCSVCPWCTCPEPTCVIVCDAVAQNALNVGTLPNDMESTLRTHSPAGYRLYRSEGNPGIDTFAVLLQEGNPIVVLVWLAGGSYGTLHWTVVTGTQGEYGVRFANGRTGSTPDGAAWSWFVDRWGFQGINGIAKDEVSQHGGIRPYIWMRYERMDVQTTLRAGDYMEPGNTMASHDGRFLLAFQEDGNFVLYPLPRGPKALWASNTSGTAAALVYMQDDGNLVIYEPGHALWASNTSGHPGAYLVLQDDGNLVIYDTDNTTALWASNTCCH
jgi:hypothetical protein